MSSSHSSSMMEISTTNLLQSSKKKRKIIFEDELRNYEPKDKQTSVSFDPMMEKLKQWKKERDLKQMNPINKSEAKSIFNTSQLLKKRSFENSLRSYCKPQQNKMNQRNNRQKISLSSFYERFNPNQSANSSQFAPMTMNRSQILSSSNTTQLHKQGFFSENNSICPTLDLNNIDFIDQIEDRIEDLYYDFMDQKISDRQQMRKEIIQILHMCDIKIIKGLMAGGIEQIKLNQQLWYIFLLNFDFKQQWKENSLNFIKENNIMESDHLLFAEQNMNIISDKQNNSLKFNHNELNNNFQKIQLNQEQNNFKKKDLMEIIEYQQYDSQIDKEEYNSKKNQNIINKSYQLGSVEEDINNESTKDFNVIDNKMALTKNEQQYLEGSFNNKQINANLQQSDYKIVDGETKFQFNSNNISPIDIMKIDTQKDLDTFIQKSIKNMGVDIQYNIDQTNDQKQQNMGSKFQWLQAVIANSNQNQINIQQNEILDESKQTEVQQNEQRIDFSIQTPQLVIQNATPDSKIKSITRRLNYNLNIDFQEQLLKFSPWKEMQNSESNSNQNNTQTHQSIFVPLKKKENENILEIRQQNEKIKKFSFGNTFQITPEQTNYYINIKDFKDHQTDKQNIIEQEISQKQQLQIQKQLFNKNNNMYSQPQMVEEEHSQNNNKNINQQQNTLSQQSQQQSQNENKQAVNLCQMNQNQVNKNQYINIIDMQQVKENNNIFDKQHPFSKININDQQYNYQPNAKLQNMNEIQKSIFTRNLGNYEKENNISSIRVQNEKVDDIHSKIFNNNNNMNQDNVQLIDNQQNKKIDQIQSQNVSTNLFIDKQLKMNSTLFNQKIQNNKENDNTINTYNTSYQLQKNLDNQQLQKKQMLTLMKINEYHDKCMKDELMQNEDTIFSENNIKKRIKNENGQYQNVLSQIQNNSQNIQNHYNQQGQHVKTEIQQNVLKQLKNDTNKLEDNEYSFNFNQNKKFISENSINQDQLDLTQNDKNSKSSCDFFEISNKISNIKLNNIFDQNIKQYQNIIQAQQDQKQISSSIQDQDLNQIQNLQINTLIKGNTKSQLNQISNEQNRSQFNLITNEQNQNLNNLFFQQNLDKQIEQQNEKQKIDENSNLNQNKQIVQEQQFEYNNISNIKQNNNQSSIKKLQTQSNKKRKCTLSPSQNNNQNICDNQQLLTFNDLFNLSKSKSKRKSILGLFIKEIENQVIEDTGSQYIKSMVCQNSQKKKYQEEEEDKSVQWVRRSLRISQKSNKKNKEQLSSFKKRTTDYQSNNFNIFKLNQHSIFNKKGTENEQDINQQSPSINYQETKINSNNI